MDRNKYVQCPCCRDRFSLSETLWIAAQYDDLKDDYFEDDLGNKTESKRFLPERFAPDWRAFDERGTKCRRTFACPKCHMEIPESYFNCEPLSVSIVGPTLAGKTFFLTALHHRLQQDPFERDYGLKGMFYDAAHYSAHSEKLEEHTDRLFHSFAPPDTVVALRADELGGNERKIFGPEGEYWVAIPYTYILREGERKRSLCLYDRAGKLFTQTVGKIGDARNVYNKILLASDILFFLYDPTQNGNCVKDYAPRYGRRIYSNGIVDKSKLIGAEEKILNSQIGESSNHVFGLVKNFIVQYAPQGLIENDKYTRYVCIVVTKCDAWEKCLSEKIQQYLREPPKGDVYGVIAEVSNEVEAWIGKHDPAFTASVRNFVKHYTYIPVSAAGRQAKKDDDSKVEGYDIGVEPLHPRWVDVPFLCALYPPQS